MIRLRPLSRWPKLGAVLLGLALASPCHGQAPPAPDAAVGDGDAPPPAVDAKAPPAAPSMRAIAEIWNAQRRPAPGPPLAVGGYASGCLQGALALKPTGPGYRVLHLERRRNFGHPALIRFVQRLAAAARKHRLGELMIGDLSQARGGPAPTGHRSHQSGLDVDIGYTPPPKPPAGQPAPDPASLSFTDVVDLRTHQMTAAWTPRIRRLLEMAASDPAVDRVFVNPAIKRRLCAEVPHSESWLSRLRPWWGHQDHFHVRLRCPEGSLSCHPQEPLPPEDGCAAVDWWLNPETQAARARRQATEAATPPPPFTLPDACNALLDKKQH